MLYVVLVLALAIGWWLGKYGLPNLPFSWQRPRSHQYLKGFTYLINEQSDAAVDSFLSQLDVNPKTLEMHIAIGSMLRRKGELERAIRIHQNLLESATLSDAELSLAQLELARDFYSAGILDRVENILSDMVIVILYTGRRPYTFCWMSIVICSSGKMPSILPTYSEGCYRRLRK